MSDFDPLVPLVDAENEFEARTIIAVLEDAGFEARIFVLGNLGLPRGLAPGARGVPVMVRRSKLDEARVALAESRALGASVDWASVDVGDEMPRWPARGGWMRRLVRLGAVVLLVAIAATFVAVLFGATRSASVRIFTITCALAFVVGVVLTAFGGGRGHQPAPESTEADPSTRT